MVACLDCLLQPSQLSFWPSPLCVSPVCRQGSLRKAAELLTMSQLESEIVSFAHPACTS